MGCAIVQTVSALLNAVLNSSDVICIRWIVQYHGGVRSEGCADDEPQMV